MENLFNLINKIFLKNYNAYIEVESELNQIRNYTHDKTIILKLEYAINKMNVIINENNNYVELIKNNIYYFSNKNDCTSLESITIKNPECEIYNITGINFNGTVYGYENSTAQAYAEKYGYKFEAIDDAPKQTTPAVTTTAVTTTTTTTTTTSPYEGLGYGDANGDGKLNVRDAAFIANKLAQGKADVSPESADFNGDGKINVRDCAYIAKSLSEAFEKSGSTLEEYIAKNADPAIDAVLKNESVSIGNVKGKAGETVDVPVIVSCNNNLESLDLLMLYDTALTAEAAIMSDTSIAPASNVFADTSTVSVVAYGSAAIKDGTIAYITFTIPDDAQPGDTYNIDIPFVKTFAIFDGGDLGSTVTRKSGTITVLAPVEPAPEENKALFDKASGLYYFKADTDNDGKDDSVTITAQSKFSENNYSELETAVIPSKIEGLPVTEIDNSAFSNCTTLKSITIGNGVTKIGYQAFFSCDSLTDVVIPESVTNIYGQAFCGCEQLSDITIYSPGCEIPDYDYSFTITNGYDTEKKAPFFNGTIHGYKGSTAEAYAEKYGYAFEPIEYKAVGDESLDMECDPDDDFCIPGGFQNIIIIYCKLGGCGTEYIRYSLKLG